MKTAYFDGVMDKVAPEKHSFYPDAAIMQILEYHEEDINLFSGQNYSGVTLVFAL